MSDDDKIRDACARVRAHLESLRHEVDSQDSHGDLVLHLPRKTAERFQLALAAARRQLLEAVRATPATATEPVAVSIARERLDRSEGIPDWLALALVLERYLKRQEASVGVGEDP